MKIKGSSVLVVIEAHLKFVLCIMLLGAFAVSLYPISISIRHNYLLGDVAVRDVKAPVNFCIEDEIMTGLFIDQVLLEVPVVYDFDPSIQNRVTSRIVDTFSQHMNLQRKIESYHVGEEKNKIDDDSVLLFLEEGFGSRKKLFAEELGLSVSDGAYRILAEHRFDEYIPRLMNSVIAQILSNGVVFDKETLLRESYRGIVLRNCENGSEKRVWDLKSFYSFDQAKAMVRIIGDPLFEDLNYALLNLIVDFSQRLIEPNIIFNSEETNKRKEDAIELVAPKFYTVKSGEMILREGEIVDQNHLTKLKVLDDKLGSSWFLIAGQILTLAFILVVYYMVQLKSRIKSKKLCNKDLILLSVILLATMLIVRIWATFPSMWYFGLPLTEGHLSNIKFGLPLAAGSMVVCLVIGIEDAFPFVFLSSVIASMLLPDKFEHCIYFCSSGAVAVWWVRDSRERGGIIKAGAKLGLFCVLMSMTIDISVLRYLQWSALTFDIAVAFIGGMSAGVVVVGVLPVVEMLFLYTTDSTLLELANLDRPILQRLMLEAPGTYHHSVVVSSMVEAAASEIGANSLLGKVCGYYHDIGKLKQPLYFVENQLGHKNRHDKLSPSMSSLVLISHVKHGIEIAKKNNLGGAIVDVIKQHHGNSLISYFFEKAKQIKGDENVNISDFRYPGPVPQTVEAGLVMLADVVEAASRTLVNPTSSRIQGLVQNLINKIFSDGQLGSCDLTLRDLNSIAKSFNKILSGIYHHRVEYQNSPYGSSTDGKSTNADNNGQQAESSFDTRKKNLSNGADSLRRLGLS